LKAIFLDDAVHAPGTDGETSLAELLGDDVDRGIRIEEAVTNDLAFDFVGADVVMFGAGLVALEPGASVFAVKFEQLKISLFAEIELLGRLGGAEPLTLTFDEHGQPGDDEVIWKNRNLSGRADDATGRDVELHGLVLRETG
jgi:hypothetical protein